MNKLLTILLLLLTGCQNTLTIQQATIIARSEGITSNIRWYSIRGNPWADGENIYISPEWVEENGLSNRLMMLLWHEEYHNRGLKHCGRKSCLMYFQYQVDLIFGSREKKLCRACKLSTKDFTGGKKAVKYVTN